MKFYTINKYKIKFKNQVIFFLRNPLLVCLWWADNGSVC